MKFDKSRVFTAVNADELKVGDKVIVADTLDLIAMLVNTGKGERWAIEEIKPENFKQRFKARLLYHSCVNKDYCYSFAFAYLMERAENCTNCGEGKWDAEHKKILCDPAHCGNGNVVFRDHEIEVCEYWKPKTKQKSYCSNCINRRLCPNAFSKDHDTAECDGYKAEMKDEQKAEKHYRPFKDTDELIKVWCEKKGEDYTGYVAGVYHDMPNIWVKRKNFPKDRGTLITSLDEDIVYVGICQRTMDELLDDYTFLDGSPCGVEE